ncbi:hypothetical protein O0S08_32860 [Nannocystis poenicansa]|uniref:Uncharacterized protein n=1 Tax=Nannocystis punicea TaxID=2995304 RepID=A0ABY7GVK9_9BACT|nr:hypothetical protein [Nannocystis poenicansa]WAS91005.1 hypothetical protein O0S08_32860 [Nannocystis poenicansa]
MIAPLGLVIAPIGVVIAPLGLVIAPIGVVNTGGSATIPRLGDRDDRTITRADVAELHETTKDTPGAANDMIMMIASLYARIIEDWELAPAKWPVIQRRPRRRSAAPSRPLCGPSAAAGGSEAAGGSPRARAPGPAAP